jgi:NAD(P)-dependent dehydrogenase (short-subunit alcohol dehydrogenase family)
LTLRVIITAGAAGIGRVIATGFADAGAEVHVCDVDHDALEKLGRDYPAIVGDGIDVSDEAALDGWLDDCLEEMGGCDVLVNNAGVAGQTGPVEEMDLDRWRQCLAINLDAQMLTCRRIMPVMKQQNAGVIINLSSTSGLYGVPFRSPYVAAKWAVIGFTQGHCHRGWPARDSLQRHLPRIGGRRAH